jgi:protein TonB
VGTDGVPLSVDVQQRSGSRDLDRAAVDAVRRWRFSPGQRDGQAIVGSVTVPVDFKMR